MALHIQDPETDRLARELSAATGATITEVVKTALREHRKTVSPAPTRSEEEYIACIKAITSELAGLPLLDTRTPDEIIGYNEHGYFD
jgi:antitoxin VapB